MRMPHTTSIRRPGFQLFGAVSVLLAVVACDGDVAAVAEAPEFAPSTKRTADCPEGDPTRERFGTDCGCCHGTQFAASGSIAERALPLVSHVEVVDRVGQVFFLPPNPYGNFFRHRPRPELPMRAKVVYRDGTERAMQTEVSEASCNHCHAQGGAVPMIGAHEK
jgi:cytochrome c5